MNMAVGLCISAYFFIALIVSGYHNGTADHHASFDFLVVSLIIWMSGILITTEFLSLFQAVSFRSLLLFYISINVGFAFWLYRRRRLLKLHAFQIDYQDNSSKLLLAFGICLIVLSGIMAFLCPPNNPDSLSYHLTRQIYWMQQGSLAHFQTPNDRLLMMPPLSEVVGLHFRILSKSDIWANFPQFTSYIFSSLIAALIARELGANGRIQLFAAYLVLTLPMAFHQASNTKNDLFLGMVLLALAWQLMRYIMRSNFSWPNWILVGLNLGLVWMVKGTGLLYSIPVMLAFGIVLILRRGRLSWRPIVVISVLAILLCFGHYARNYRWYGSIFGDVNRPGYDLTIKNPSPKSLLSNLVRNVSLHFGLPHSGWNASHYQLVEKLHDWLKIDLNDPRTTYWSDKLRFGVDYAPHIETKAPAPLHLIAALLVPFLIAAFRCPGSLWRFIYWCLPFFSFLLFCLFVKWQPWNVRLHLPIFCLACPVIAAVISEGKNGRLAKAVTASLLCLLMLPSINSYSRPVFQSSNVFNTHSADLQYRYFPEWKQSQMEIYKMIQHLKPTCIQFDLEWAWQYPLQQMINEDTKTPPHFWGQVAPYPSPEPDMVITWSERSEKSIFAGAPADRDMIKIVKHAPFLVYVDKALLAANEKN